MSPGERRDIRGMADKKKPLGTGALNGAVQRIRRHHFLDGSQGLDFQSSASRRVGRAGSAHVPLKASSLMEAG
jgi:hypothetical protein